MLSFSFQPFPELITTRLRLRAMNSGDVSEVFTLRSDAGVNQYLDRPPAVTETDAIEWMEKIYGLIARNESISWVIARREDARMVGSICIWNLSKENACGELGYELLPGFQGQGIMQEAMEAVVNYGFDVMQLRRIEAWTHPENNGSIRLLENNGFRPIGSDEEEKLAIAKEENMLVYFRLNEHR